MSVIALSLLPVHWWKQQYLCPSGVGITKHLRSGNTQSEDRLAPNSAGKRVHRDDAGALQNDTEEEMKPVVCLVSWVYNNSLFQEWIYSFKINIDVLYITLP